MERKSKEIIQPVTEAEQLIAPITDDATTPAPEVDNFDETNFTNTQETKTFTRSRVPVTHRSPMTRAVIDTMRARRNLKHRANASRR